MKRGKMVGEEHINFDAHGNVLGLFTIDALKAREHYGAKRYWEGVRELIREYTNLNPIEMQLVIEENTLSRDQSFDEFAGSTAGTFRQAITIPVGLLNLLEQYDPTIITEKRTRHEFMRLFPMLRACRTI